MQAETHAKGTALKMMWRRDAGRDANKSQCRTWTEMVLGGGGRMGFGDLLRPCGQVVDVQ